MTEKTAQATVRILLITCVLDMIAGAIAVGAWWSIQLGWLD